MQNMIDVKEVVLECFINVSIKDLQVVLLNVKLYQIKN